VREIKSLEGTVADLRATIERQAREQGSREALLTAAEGQIEELQGECQQERVRFLDILQKVNAAFKAKHFGGPQAAEDTPETAAAAPAAAAAAPVAVAPGGLSAEEAAELKQRVVDSEKKAEAAAVSYFCRFSSFTVPHQCSISRRSAGLGLRRPLLACYASHTARMHE
jgi:hypothetical protein